MTHLLETYRGYVSLAQCDEMSHMNIQFYVAKQAEALGVLMAALGAGQVTVQHHHIRFHRELRVSDLVAMKGGIVSIGDRAMVVYQDMANALTRTRAATFITELSAPQPWTHEVRAATKALTCTVPAEATPRSLKPETREPDLARADADAGAENMAVTNRSMVNPWECDAHGRFAERFHMARYSDCQGHMWARAGLSRHQQADKGLATATVEMRLNHFEPLQAGQTILVHTGIERQSAKTLRYRHWLFNGETGALSSTMEGIALLFDKDSRKAVALPDDIYI